MPTSSENKNPAPPGAMAAPPGAFAIRTSTLCGQLQLSRTAVSELRLHHLVRHVHWDYVKKRVCFSAVGAELLRALAAFLKELPAQPSEPAQEDCATPRPPVVPAGLLLEKNPLPVPFAGVLFAWAMPSRNPRLLICYLPDTDPTNPLNLVSCFVRTNVNFLRGMKLPGPGRTVLQVSDNTFELSGQPPRFRGRW